MARGRRATQAQAQALPGAVTLALALVTFGLLERLGRQGLAEGPRAFSLPSRLDDAVPHRLYLTSCGDLPCKFQRGGGLFHGQRRREWGLQVAQDESVVVDEPEAKGTIIGTSASTAKGMVGSGILSLSAGVAGFTNSPQGLGFSVAMLLAFTCYVAYSFQLVAWVSAETGSNDFGEAWSASVGERFAWVPRLAVIAISAISCIIYAMLLGDLLASILRGLLSVGTVGGVLGGLKSSLLPWCQKGPVLVILAAFILLPLCLQENFSNLSFLSILGLSAATYLTMFVLLRSLDGSYLPGGRFFAMAPYKPRPLVAARKLHEVVNAKTLVLLSNFGMAYMNHGMAPPTYQELIPVPNTSGDEARRAKLVKYRWVSVLAFGLAGVLCATTMVAGFRTFGAASAGNVLANYATTDTLATFARACVWVSVLCGFPLNFVILRNEVDGIMDKKGWTVSKDLRRLMVVGILTSFVIAALLLGDLGKVQAVGGSTLGSFVVYLAPAIMAGCLRRKMGLRRPLQVVLEAGLLALGGVVTVVGLFLSLRS